MTLEARLTRWTWGLALLLQVASSTTASSQATRPEKPLKDVKTWMCQLQGVDSKSAIRALASSDYDLLVVEPTMTYGQGKDFDAKAMVDQLHAGKRGRLVLAYLDIGEADSNRAYWQKSWRAPSKDAAGDPDFLIKADPEGWKDTYVVKYTDPRWQEFVLADLRRIMAAGFDGLYLDWIEGYEDADVSKALRAQGGNPAKSMVDFILLIRSEAQKIHPSSILVGQNAPYLMEEDERLPQALEGVAFENTWFRGKAEVSWKDAPGGDIPNSTEGKYSTESRLKQYAKFLALGKPVFTIDYCLKSENASRVYEESRKQGFIPLVSRTSLERLTETPPPRPGDAGEKR